MARAIWTGSLAFGLVNVPVGLFSATEDKTIHFNQFQAGTTDRIRYKRVNERTGREVELADIVRGYDVGDGDYVLVSDEELEAVEPGRSRTIDIDDFVDLAEIDPVYYNKTYYLGPQGDAAHAYALLHRAMSETGKAGIATFVMHGKQHLVAIRPAGDVLALQTMYFSDEVRDPDQVIDDLPADKKLPPRELTVAKQLIGSMTSAWDAGQYRDTYRDLVQDMIKRKQKGQEVLTEGEPESESNVTDLMDALRRSAEQMRGRRPAKSAGRPSTAARQGGEAAGRTAGSSKSSSTTKSGTRSGAGSGAKSATRRSAPARSSGRRKAS